MPNLIKNRITLNGSLEDINSFIESFSTKIKSQFSKAHNGQWICSESETKQFRGWFNPKDGIFTFQKDKSVQIGLPENMEPEIRESFLLFPDLYKVVPMPEILKDTSSPNNVNAKECIEATGFPDWYSWKNKNWGTKWGAYNCERKAINIFEFDTAWSAIPEMVRLMHQEFPCVEITYKYSDEDTGYNCGIYKFKKRECEENIFEGGSLEAYELAFDLRPSYKENYVLIDGNYKYSDE